MVTGIFKEHPPNKATGQSHVEGILDKHPKCEYHQFMTLGKLVKLSLLRLISGMIITSSLP